MLNWGKKVLETVSDVGSGDYVVMFFCHIPMTG
jgi:hypothetical protein